MKILEPVQTIPSMTKDNRRWSRYRHIWRKVEKLDSEMWLPVKCQSRGALQNLQITVVRKFIGGCRLQTKRDGLTLYIKKRDASGCARKRKVG